MLSLLHMAVGWPMNEEEFNEVEMVDPLTPQEIDSRWRYVQRQLFQITVEFKEACDREAEAKSEYDRIFLTEHLLSLENHPERSAVHHKAVAEKAALDAKTRLNCAVSDRRSLALKAENLRTTSSGLQTQAKQAGVFIGGA